MPLRLTSPVATASRSPDAPLAMSGVPSTLFLVAIVILFTVSGGMLWLVGYNYDGLTGSPITKIHPGTYLTVLIVGMVAVQQGNPVALGVDFARRQPAGLFLLAVALVLFVHIVTRAGPGMAGTIDANMLPPLVILLYQRADEATRRHIELVIHATMALNAVVGLGEFTTKHLLFPFRLDGVDFVTDTRSSALQGHPLGNATITCVYILALVSGGGRLPTPVRFGIVVLQLMAMVAFGGRSALVTTILLGGFQGLVAGHRLLRTGRVPLLGLATAVLIATLAPLVVLGLVTGGFFDALLMRFNNDGGSAAARVEMLELVRQIPFRDLMVGPDTGYVESLRRIYGLELGIENPIVRTLIYQGAIVTGLLVLGIGLFLRELTRDARCSMALPLIGFLIVVNTFESLAGKSTMLAKIALMLVVLYRRTDRRAPARRQATAPPRPGTHRPAYAGLRAERQGVAATPAPRPSPPLRPR